MADYIAAFSFLGNPLYWGVLLFAVLVVGTIGMVPGVGTTTIAAVALPILIFNVSDPLIALTFLAAMGGLNNTLDSIPAVLLGYPGAATQVTFLEGHQLAMRGKAAHTLGAIYAVSAMGGIIGAVVLLATMPLLRPIFVRFSFPEIAAMALFGVLMVSVLSRGAMLKGIIAGLLGILIGTVGVSYIAGDLRYDLGTLYLYEGLPLIPTLIGIFAFPELIDLTMRGQPISTGGRISTSEVLSGVRYGLSRWKMTLRQSLFGVFLGAVPGIGSAVVDWLAYAFGIGFAKDKSQFGKGSLDGVLFAESAQNSKEAGQAIPTLAFGIPGGASWAIVLVAMIIYGVTPGIGMLDINRHLSVTMAIVTTLALGNLFITMLGVAFTGQIAKLTLVPYPLLAATLLPLVFLAGYATTNHWGDILVICSMGALGLSMKWLGWPRPPLLLGFILGPVIERNLWPSMQVWGFGVLTRPITVVLVLIAVGAVIYLTRALGKGSTAAQAAEASGLTGEEATRTPAGGAGEEPPTAVVVGPAPVAAARRLQWRWSTIFPLMFIPVVVWTLWEAQSFAIDSSKFIPQMLGVALLPLLVLDVIRSSLPVKGKADIMDLGMRTGTDAAAVRRLAIVVGWIAGFIISIGIVGMPAATIGFALIFGYVNLKWRGRKRLWSVIPPLIIASLVFILFEQVMYIDWPERFWNLF